MDGNGPDEHDRRREQRRLAQVRYRRQHGKRLAQIAQVRNILARQDTYADDVEQLAGLLQALLGPAFVKALRSELGRRKPAR